MNRTTTIVAILLALTVNTNADILENFTPIQEKAWSHFLNLTYVNKYVDPSGGALIHDSSSFQPYYRATHESGLFLDTWSSGELGSEYMQRENGFGSEIDLGGGWGGPFFDTKLDFEGGFSYWATGDLTDSKDDAILTYAKLSKTSESEKQTLTPYVALSHYTILNSAPLDGFVAKIGIDTERRINEKLSIIAGGFLAYDEGTWGNKDGFIGKLKAGLSWKVNKALTLQPFVEYYKQINTRDTREDQVVYGISAPFEW